MRWRRPCASAARSREFGRLLGATSSRCSGCTFSPCSGSARSRPSGNPTWSDSAAHVGAAARAQDGAQPDDRSLERVRARDRRRMDLEQPRPRERRVRNGAATAIRIPICNSAVRTDEADRPARCRFPWKRSSPESLVGRSPGTTSKRVAVPTSRCRFSRLKRACFTRWTPRSAFVCQRFAGCLRRRR
jgi:hypothetical protein